MSEYFLRILRYTKTWYVKYIENGKQFVSDKEIFLIEVLRLE
jgi:hypothetical protein